VENVQGKVHGLSGVRVRIPMQDYKSVCVAVMTSATEVNTHTHTLKHTDGFRSVYDKLNGTCANHCFITYDRDYITRMSGILLLGDFCQSFSLLLYLFLS